ncbi:hypothetical protein TrST_g13384 [Triparma strigata]|uniref:Calmodulin n=1 Tax=Triparma strigata TaxID=1606541 RepID=A0A9W7BZN0_9STRA|nr:hypothetical protein TrST_g13384 [Triparma strigata]
MNSQLSIFFSIIIFLGSTAHSFVHSPTLISSASLPTYSTTSLTAASTAVLLLSSNLRLSDNQALNAAVELGPGGLSILYKWNHNPIPQTPSQFFEAAAIRSFNSSLTRLNDQELTLIDGNDVVVQLERIINDLDPTNLVVDFQDTTILNKVQTKFPKLKLTVVPSSHLHHPSTAQYALGRSRKGGRILRWSTYLSGMLNEPIAPPIPSPQTLPLPIKLSPSLTWFSAPPLSKSYREPEWAKHILNVFPPTESEALLRSSQNPAPNTPTTNLTTNLGNANTIPPSSHLSPYLRFGIISPPLSSSNGVRTRDLLWRDWSHMCHNMVEPLKRGDPIVAVMDGTCVKFEGGTGEGGEGGIRGQQQQLDKFNMWVVGNTGSPIVDAGMRQLWLEGWMPRHVRLLCASCLVEGLGVDWRRGRSWFEHTLVDYDPAINSMMWQNAGLVGIDPFYTKLKWEVEQEHFREYVQKYLDADLKWPKHLSDYAELRPDPNLVTNAQARRDELKNRNVYRAAKKIVNTGVRVNWKNGEIIGVGNTPVEELDFNIDMSASDKFKELQSKIALEHLDERFKEADLDGSGELDFEELGEFCKKQGMNFTNREWELLVESLDADNSGTVSLQEFKQWWSSHFYG